jgi:hypothetical protein
LFPKARFAEDVRITNKINPKNLIFIADASLVDYDDGYLPFFISLGEKILSGHMKSLKTSKQNRAVLGGKTSVVHRCGGSGRGANSPETDVLGLKEL